MREQNLPVGGGASQLREYVHVLRRYARSIIAITVLVVVAAGALSFVMPAKYESDAKVLVKPITLVSGQPNNQIAPNMNTEQQIATSLAVATIAADSLHLKLTPQQITNTFLKKLKVSTNADTEILNFAYTARTATLAQSRAAAFADAYLQFRRNQVVDDLTNAQISFQQRIDALNAQLASTNRQLSDTRDPGAQDRLRTVSNQLIDEIGFLQGQTGLLVTPTELGVGAIVEPATLPIRPVTSHVRDLALAVLVGLVLGVGIAFLRDRLDDRLRSRNEVESVMHAPVVGVLPFVPRRGTAGLTVASSREHGVVPDAFRALRTGLMFTASRMSGKTFVVTSPVPEDGKTTTVANLGLSLAQAGKKVILISADLRRPRLHQLFGCTNDIGLTSVLAGERMPWEALVALQTRNLLLLPSGPSPSNVIDLLDSEAMRKLLAEFRVSVDYVLIDTGPVLGAADAMALAPLVDGVLVVMNAQQTTRSAANRTRKQLELVNARVMGTVLYDASEAGGYGYYYYDYEPDDGYHEKRSAYTEKESSGNGSYYRPTSTIRLDEVGPQPQPRAVVMPEEPHRVVDIDGGAAIDRSWEGM